MPIYEYRCDQCGSPFEKLRPMREAESPTECPRCGHVVAKKELSACCVSVGGSSGSSGGNCGGGSRFT